MRELDAAAKAAGMSLVPIAMDSPQDFQAATAAVVREHADAIVTIGDSSYILSKEFAEICNSAAIAIDGGKPAVHVWRRADVLWC